MLRRRNCLLLVIGALLLAILAVSIPAWLLQRNPPVVQEPDWDSPATRALAVRACFDCHSNQTNWPWFTRFPPGSWLAVFDTVRGRRHLNFSTWGLAGARADGEGGRGEERGVARTIENGSMPPGTYLMMHPEARLTDAEKQQLIRGLQVSLQTQ